jgi:asparagine synthase (glutamine-hydrolysing)
MCGIIGYSGAIDSGCLNSGLQVLVHRGPDDAGSFIERSCKIGLAHTRLSIIDLSEQGHQPMSSRDGLVVLVFNGEIYNFRELRTTLEKKGISFRSNSDTEVVLELYRDQGISMLKQLNGIFALAIWDKSDQTLFVARDAFGVKPLYYAQTITAFTFASEIKALLCLVPDLNELDVASLHRYLTFLWCPGAGTPLKDVRKLGPGEAISVKAGRIVKKWQWYQLPFFRKLPVSMDIPSAIAGTVDHLKQAVQRQMVADVPVGAFLSGGLDSSSIVAFARQQVNDIHCFTIDSGQSSNEGISDDLPYAHRVAEHLNVPLDVVRVDAKDMASDIEMMIAQLDEPLADPAALNVLYISRLARQQGYKVLLSGAGGDDLFTGYRRHLALRYEKFWHWLPATLRDYLETKTSNLDQQKPLYRRLTKLFHGAGLEGDERLVSFFFWAKESQLFSLYSQDFKAELGQQEAASPMFDFLRPLPKTVSAMERMLALEQRFFLTDHNLTYTDKMSMAASVEVRVPFLDLDLVDFAATIPDKYKQRGKTGKWILKKAMEPYLPKDVIYRPKSGFGVPLRHWMRYELRELLGDLLSEDSIKSRGLFTPRAVQELIHKNDTGQVDAAYTLFSLMSIEIWIREFIDGKN